MCIRDSPHRQSHHRRRGTRVGHPLAPRRRHRDRRHRRRDRPHTRRGSARRTGRDACTAERVGHRNPPRSARCRGTRDLDQQRLSGGCRGRRRVRGQADPRLRSGTRAVTTFDASFIEDLDTLFAWRRDVRNFRSDPLEPELLDELLARAELCLLYTSPSPRDQRGSRMPSSA